MGESTSARLILPPPLNFAWQRSGLHRSQMNRIEQEPGLTMCRFGHYAKANISSLPTIERFCLPARML